MGVEFRDLIIVIANFIFILKNILKKYKKIFIVNLITKIIS